MILHEEYFNLNDANICLIRLTICWYFDFLLNPGSVSIPNKLKKIHGHKIHGLSCSFISVLFSMTG